jgi:hypothetical protein
MPVCAFGGLVPLQPRAAPFVVLGKYEHHGLATAAFAEEPVLMPVRGGTCYRNRCYPELVVERRCCFWGHPAAGPLGLGVRPLGDVAGFAGLLDD